MKASQLVSNCIKDYNLLDSNKDIIVAYSGGKDSFSLCKILLSLGYHLRPVIIDIGYDVDWSCAIKNLQTLGLSCEVISIEFVSKYLKNIFHEVNVFFDKVKEINKKGQNALTTICTPCYNAKHLILCELTKLYNINTVAFGHHGTDAVASFLKSYFMFIDRWELSHEIFAIHNIYRLVDATKCYFDNKDVFNHILFKKLVDLINKRKISTDEPPLSKVNENVRFIRPLFYCMEKDVKEYVPLGEYSYVRSECEYKFRTKKILTSREYIQEKILNENLDEDIFNILISLIRLGLKVTGEVVYDARRNRDIILGKNYKNDGICQKL